MGCEVLRLRKQALGNRNLIGERVEEARKKKGMKQKELLAQLQVRGIDMNASGLSKLEGQIQELKDAGVVFCDLTDYDAWVAAVQPIYDQYAKGYEDLVESIRNTK